MILNNFISSIQWLFFILASSIVAPLSIADLYGLTAGDTTLFLQRTLWVLGIAGILQVVFGHKLPISEGPAGLWWGIFVVYASLTGTIYVSSTEALQAMEGAFLIAGITFILISLFSGFTKILPLFTPFVTGVYLLLLVLSLGQTFVQGMFGFDVNDGRVHFGVLGVSIFVVVLTFFLSKVSYKWIGSYAILWSLLVGWGVYALFSLPQEETVASSASFSFPQVFAFGMPTWDASTVMTSVFVTLLLMANTLASIRVMEGVLNQGGTPSAPVHYKQTGIVAGVNHLFSGLFAAVGPVPIAGAAGFVKETGHAKKTPFILANVWVVFIASVPALLTFVSGLPLAIGYSVTLYIFLGMFILAVNSISTGCTESYHSVTLAIAVVASVASFSFPVNAFLELPPFLVAFFQNGILVGTMIALVGEQCGRLVKKKEKMRE